MRKKLFAILMSAMMMVTFMPAMAFAAYAAPTEKFVTKTTAFDTLQITYDGETAEIPTVRLMHKDGSDMGIIQAYTDEDTTRAYLAKHDFKNENYFKNRAKLYKLNSPYAKYFYDLNGAVISGVKDEVRWVNRETAFEVSGNATYAIGAGLTVAVPTYVTNYDAKKYTTQTVGSLLATNRTVKFVATGYDPDVKTTQTVKVETIISAPTPDNYYEILGTAPTKTVTVLAKELGRYDVDFYVDTVEKANKVKVEEEAATIDPTYDGAEHKIVNNTVEGVTVKYQKWDTAKAAYVDVDAITYKDVTDAVYYRAVVSKANRPDRVVAFTVAVQKANIFASFADNDYNVNVVMEGTTIDPMNFVKFTENEAKDSDAEKAAKKAIKADEAALKAALAIKYDIVAVKAESSLINAATLKALSITNIVDVYGLGAKVKTTFADDTAAQKAFKNATANFEINVVDFDEGYVVVVTGNLDNEIEFVQAPAVKKYHNKKGVLKKSYSFTVKAVATSGVAPTYKLINGNSKIVIDKTTGKITVKKGLKKGTYTVKVKAYGAAGNGYKAASETQTIKIVLTK